MASQIDSPTRGQHASYRQPPWGCSHTAVFAAVLCLLVARPGQGNQRSSWAGKTCPTSQKTERSALGQGVRVLITQFVARTRSVEKFLPRLGERYARELKHLMRTEGTSPVAEVPHTILSLPCVVADQGAALALAKSWHADLVIWGMVGAEPINPVELPANSAAGPIAESVSVTASSVQVAGAVISQGNSLSCIGNVNNCHLYVFQAVRHPLESEVVPVVTSSTASSIA